MLRRAWLAVLAMACTSSPTASATPGSGSQAAKPVPQPPPIASTGAQSDVAPVAEKTSVGGEVIAVGVPRFELVEGKNFGPLALRTAASTVFAEDAHWVSLWNAATGAPTRNIAPRTDDLALASTSLAVSQDGKTIATGSSQKVRVFRAPFDQPVAELACYNALAISHDGKLLACSTTKLAIWDIAKRQIIASLPANAPKDRADKVVFAADDRSVVWTSDRGIMRWDLSPASSVTAVYQAPGRVTHAALAEGGAAAYVAAGNQAAVVDLATGKAEKAAAQFGTAISPTGKRLSAGVPGAIQVTEASTGKVIWSAKVTEPVLRAAFGENDDSLVYVEARRLRVVALPGTPVVPQEPSRFAGWLGSGVAAIERDHALRSFTLASKSWGAAERAALAAKPLDGAPAWATWVADDITAAEPSKRHELAPVLRGAEPCEPKLRVWTKVGGPKTLSMTCSKPELENHEDPGWAIGGGWAVGVSATTAIVYDARTGKRVGVINVPPRRNKHPEFAPAYWQAAVSPAGDWLALVWRRARLQGSEIPGDPDPREDAMHNAEAAFNVDCMTGESGCQLEYFVELWSLKGTPKRAWQTRLERKAPGRELVDPATPSAALTFDRSGTSLVIGFADGEVRIVPTAAPSSVRSERLHRAPIRRVEIDAVGSWIMSEDAAREQRLWRLAP